MRSLLAGGMPAGGSFWFHGDGTGRDAVKLVSICEMLLHMVLLYWLGNFIELLKIISFSY